MNPRIFRAYDVRGVADTDLTDPFARDLGRAYGTMVRRDGGRVVCLGRDCRTHGPRLHAAFLSGLLSTGLEVLDVGVVSSPLLYFAVFHHDTDGGVQITGSHNPAEDNGFKMMHGKDSLHGDQVQHLRRLIEARDFVSGEGSVRQAPVLDAYLERVSSDIALGGRRLKVVVDGGNGTGGPVAVALLERLGVEVVPMYIEMDGRFPNHHPDPTVEENLEELIARVRSEGADCGVAYDGDADRIGVIDDRGEILWGDRLMILLSRAILRACPGAAIVSEVKCSATLFDDIEAHGGRAIMAPVGHSIIKRRMKDEQAELGGEMSGHIFFRHRWMGFDDAVYTTARLLEILAAADRPLSALLDDVPRTHVTPEIRLDASDDTKFALVEAAAAWFGARHPVVDIDGARVDFGDGWGLIRASNTQPVIVLRAEADSPEALARIRGTLEAFVAKGAPV
ncbi:MAG: phosphomannomutase/phosphoglucomutase [Deltaproteobacteria bacterium]|nr:phosphomannomutase/phosphoglucomutase [Deltaproteobacteria bacterium]MCB9785569.1 phosphomannomutase/phosphoglucomutase [Deltaproteobacteria bacterium]